MELEDLKQNWKEMNKRIDNLEKENRSLTERIRKGKAVSAKQRLIRRFRLLVVVCLCSPACLVNINFDGAVGDWTIRLFILFFMVMAAHKGYMCWKLTNIDYNRMTVKEALLSIYQLKKVQRVGTVIGLTLAVPVLLTLFIDFYRAQNEYLLYGAWSGLIIGGIMGLFIRKRIRQEFKEMYDALNDELDGELGAA